MLTTKTHSKRFASNIFPKHSLRGCWVSTIALCISFQQIESTISIGLIPIFSIYRMPNFLSTFIIFLHNDKYQSTWSL